MTQTHNDIKIEHFQVLQVEIATGKLLTTEGHRVTHWAVHVILVDSLEDARRIARGIVAEKPHIECCIRDNLGVQVEIVSGVGFSAPQKSFTWWQRLFRKGK